LLKYLSCINGIREEQSRAIILRKIINSRDMGEKLVYHLKKDISLL
jgi:hypothetical protein